MKIKIEGREFSMNKLKTVLLVASLMALGALSIDTMLPALSLIKSYFHQLDQLVELYSPQKNKRLYEKFVIINGKNSVFFKNKRCRYNF